MTDAQQHAKSKILIIDDDRELLETLSVVLASDGCKVTCATSANEGRSLLEGEQYDLILVDLRMPRMDGHQFLRTARLLDPSCKVVMMSAYATGEAVAKAEREGAFGYLIKPFKLAELQDILRRTSRESPLFAHKAGIGNE